MKRVWSTSVLAGVLAGTMILAAPVLADVKTGVDAWQQGDYAKAIAEWRPLAQAGDPDAQFNLGQAYKLGRGVPADFPTALDWYRKATVQGHLRAEDNLGLLMFQQGDRAGAMPYLQNAAARGERRAQYIVGTTLFNGDLIGKDWVRAYALMTRAASAGLTQATASLQQMDKFIPEDQRKQGLALATTLEAKEQQSMVAAAAAAPARPAGPTVRPPPAPVRTAQLPASDVGRPTQAPAPVTPAARPAARPAAPTPAASGNWRVQLGAFSEDGRARALWTALGGKVSGLSAYQPYLVKSGNITRLQAGPLKSSAEASRLCGAIKAAGSDCITKKM